MKWVCIIAMILLLLCGCTAKTDQTVTSNELRTFSPLVSEESDVVPSKTEKRGIIKSVTSPDKTKIAYIFTFDATADVVEYVLSVKSKSETFTYDETQVAFRSTLLFDVEWGDDATLMVSLDEMESKVPTPIEQNGVMIMFGQVSSIQ